MHDAIAGERLGVPSIGIMTTKFVSAAELMARVLGADDYAFVVTEHPMSSAAQSILADRAREAVSAGIKILIGPDH